MGEGPKLTPLHSRTRGVRAITRRGTSWTCFGDRATPEAGADVEKYPPY